MRKRQWSFTKGAVTGFWLVAIVGLLTYCIHAEAMHWGKTPDKVAEVPVVPAPTATPSTHDDLDEPTPLPTATARPPERPTVKPTPLVPEALPEMAWGPSRAEWTRQLMGSKATFKAIDVVPIDAPLWCPKFKQLNSEARWVFWLRLLSMMAKYESGFKADTKFTECSKSKSTYGSSGKWFPARGEYCIPGHKLDGGVAISRGIFQLSFQSALSYGCPLKTPQDLHDPVKNIDCALRIVDRWVGRTKAVAGRVTGEWAGWGGCARYHSVCRDVAGKTSYKAILAYAQGTPGCK